MKSKYIIFIIIIFTSLLYSCTEEQIHNEHPVTYYVSSINGSLSNDGLSIQYPLADIEQVNKLALKPGDIVLFERNSVLRGNLIPVSGSKEQPITYASYGEGELPVIMGSASIFDIVSSFEKLDENIYGIPAGLDVGNIIFNEGELFGVKKFELYDLINPLDYFFDKNRGVLFIYADEELDNLLKGEDSEYYSVEFCATQNIVDLNNKHDLIFKDLAVKNGGAHGFGGSNIYRVNMNGCQISYIGGGFLHYDLDNNPIRYGNGIELFDSGRDICVENCEIFEIFDTGLTNQGSKDKAIQKNISYINNTVYNCGMSAFELWLKGDDTQMTGITFEGNTVHDIGYGFSLTQQREDAFGLGYFIINFGSDADITDISITNNTFKNIYNEFNYGALLLDVSINTPIEEDAIYKGIENNIVEGVSYRAIYTIEDETYFLE